MANPIVSKIYKAVKHLAKTKQQIAAENSRKGIGIVVNERKAAAKRDLKKAIEKRNDPETYKKRLTKEERYQQAIDDSYRKHGGSKLPKAQDGKTIKKPKQYINGVSKASSVKPSKSISRPRYPIAGTSRRFNDAQRDSVIKSWSKKIK